MEKAQWNNLVENTWRILETNLNLELQRIMIRKMNNQRQEERLLPDSVTRMESWRDIVRPRGEGSGGGW